MSGTPVFGRPVSRSIHRAALVTLGLVFAASIDGGALRAQGTPQSGQNGSSMRQGQRMGMRMGMAMRRHRGMMGMMSDPAARILDEQSMLQLSGAQVSQLIALHESTRKEMKAVTDQLRAMMPRAQGQTQGQAAGGRRPQLTQAQRDNLATLMDSLHTIRWRATSAADSVLTTDQRHVAMRLEMARRSRMRHSFGGGRGFGGGMQRMGPGGPGGMRGMRGMRAPNDSGPSHD